jgi:hypothetical protein
MELLVRRRHKIQHRTNGGLHAGTHGPLVSNRRASDQLLDRENERDAKTNSETYSENQKLNQNKSD